MLTKLKLAFLVATPLVAGAATFAAAQAVPAAGAPQAAPTAGGPHAHDHAGKLDDAERAARRAEHQRERLARYDTNKDGKLDDAERAAMRDARITARFAAMDRDSDGKLTLDEWKAGAGARGGHHHARHRDLKTR